MIDKAIFQEAAKVIGGKWSPHFRTKIGCSANLRERLAKFTINDCKFILLHAGARDHLAPNVCCGAYRP
jgi:hypothetical protein